MANQTSRRAATSPFPGVMSPEFFSCLSPHPVLSYSQRIPAQKSVRPGKTPGPAGKSGAKPARSRRCICRGLTPRCPPHSVPLEPHRPREGGERLAGARKPAFVCFPRHPRGNGRVGDRCSPLCDHRGNPAVRWAESGVRRSFPIPKGGLGEERRTCFVCPARLGDRVSLQN